MNKRLICLLIFTSTHAIGALSAESKSEHSLEVHEQTEETLDSAVESLNEMLVDDESPLKKSETDYHLFLGSIFAYDTRETFKIKPDVSLRLVLPGLKKRVRILFNSSDRAQGSDSFDYLDRGSQPDQNGLGIGTKGLGAELKIFQFEHSRLLLQEYLRLHHNDWPDPVSRALYEIQARTGPYQFHWRVGPHWDPKRDFGALFEPSVSITIAPKRVLHLYSGFQYWYPDGYFKEEFISLKGILNEKSAIFSSVSYEYQISPYHPMDVTYSLGYRRRVFFPWLTSQITPSLILDGQDEWELVYRIALGFQVSFGSNYTDVSNFLSF